MRLKHVEGVLPSLLEPTLELALCLLGKRMTPRAEEDVVEPTKVLPLDFLCAGHALHVATFTRASLLIEWVSVPSTFLVELAFASCTWVSAR